MSLTRVHPGYDPIFDNLVNLLVDGESFDADILEDKDWALRFKEMQAVLKSANRTLTQRKRRGEFLVGHVFVAKEAMKWIDPDQYVDYLELWDRAVQEGFLPDCVCQDGPTPGERWTDLPATPVKPLGKRSVVTSSSSGVSVTLPNSVSGITPPSGTHHSPYDQPASVLVPTNPSTQQATDALHSFLQGGTTGGSLPISGNLGISSSSFSPTTSSSLPTLNTSPSNPWVAPSSQPIYDMNKFHQTYVETEDKFVLNNDGTITTKKGGKRISNPKEWVSAAQNLGQAMAGSASDHQFVWSDFILWLQLMNVLFDSYLFYAVVECERAWRRWRRANRLPWSATNPTLRDLFLTGKGFISVPRPPLPPKTGTVTTTICHDFSRSTCSRLTLCRYSHKCK
jgi:hypothetical protein